ncbi:undecaprenyl-phosphate alpha-N-acetylglucosaminyl 1-phosphate transferase [Candidatus Thioglobus sp.]|nr:undecaprenyl-phosphate alpha-N-acetylglucosaminyl 1-phosphate transferase [Candidatus Thioglobus sp.]
MNIPLLPILVASITTLVAIYLLRPFAISINLVDHPNSRKLHDGSVPLIGGIAMFLGVIASVLTSSIDLNQFNYFLLTSLIIVIVGVLDDHRDISVSLRILFQVLVSIIIISLGGVLIESFGNLLGNGNIILNEWAYFITVIAIITGMNAVNMTDGVHGLAGGNSLITFLAIAFLSKDSPYQISILISFLFCAVLPVFLIHNLCLGLPVSKRIFMGDAGSMFIGLAIVWSLIDLSQGEDRAFAPVIVLWLFALPLIEMVLAILRRLTSGQSPFKADLGHTHHILALLKIRKIHILLLELLASLVMAVIGVLGELYGVADRVMFFGFLLVFGVYLFSYKMTLKQVLSSDT